MRHCAPSPSTSLRSAGWAGNRHRGMCLWLPPWCLQTLGHIAPYMKTLLTSVLLILLTAASALATDGIITGTFVTPSTSVPLRNATVTFTLNQSSITPATFLVVPTPVSCYTTANGGIKGVPDPTATPVASANLASGSVPAGTYYIRITYYGSMVETLPSPTRSVVLSGTGRLLVTAPVLQPVGATGYKVYVGTVSGSEKLQATTSGWSSSIVSAYSTITAATPASNNTVCSMVFNDATIPAPTTYRVAVVDANSNSVPGFPQQWYLAGSTFDISNGYPVAINVQTRFPQPIIANPSSNALQSVNSPLTVNGYDMKIGADVYTGIASHAVSASGQAALWYDTTQSKLMVSVNGAAAVDVLALTPALPLTQLQGGTNRSTTIASGQIVYSDGSTYQGTSGLAWDNVKTQLTVTGRYIVKASAQVNPPADTGSMQMYYNSIGQNALLYAASNDGSGGGTGKPFYLVGSELVFAIGDPDNFPSIFGVTSDGPKWHLATVAEDAMESTATLIKVPTGVTATQSGWLQVVDSDGDVAYIPVFK